MKTQFLTITKISFLVFFLSISIVSCSTDSSDDEEMEMEEEQEEGDPDLPIVDGTFSATVDGVAFEPYEILGVYRETITNEGNVGALSISARNEARDEEFRFISYIESFPPGSYDIDLNNNIVPQVNLLYVNSVAYPDFGSIYGAITGNITIVSHDVAQNRIIGTFRFTTGNISGQTTPFDITAGAFDINYREL